MKYDAFVNRVQEAVLHLPGASAPALRAALLANTTTAIPADLAPYLEKVRHHGYRVTDEDIEALKRAGHSEDAIFELTAAAALGAALMRLETGRRVLRENVETTETR